MLSQPSTTSQAKERLYQNLILDGKRRSYLPGPCVTAVGTASMLATVYIVWNCIQDNKS